MRLALCILIPVAVTACAAPPRESGSGPAGQAARAPAAVAEAWQVTGSQFEVRVYRDGPMRALGHDHLITTQAVTGEIALREPLTESGFELHLPLGALVVDDPEARSRAGGQFATPVPDRDRDATRRNLLGERVLDAARQGEILLSAESISGGPGRYEARVRVSLAGREHVVAAPFTLELDGERLVARADFSLTHEQLGLEPFAVALGALRVRADFEVGVTVEARRRS